MKTHLEDKPKSGAHKADCFEWRYAAICGETFLGGGPEHRIADPGKAPTCPDCNAKRDGGEE
jgi:hypothetical protein